MTFDIKENLNYLYNLQRLGIKVGLDQTTRFLSEIGDPQDNLKLAHVAGTNGKGSTCKMISNILIEHGLKTGLYTSPHLLKFNERIKINGEDISNSSIIDFIYNNKEKIKRIHTTFFETTTAMAFDYFSRKRIDFGVIETGLGGRLDSTNVINPEICVITAISLDHTDILGKTINEITNEKAGIIKYNTPIVTFDQGSKIMKIIREKAKTYNAQLTIVKPNKINLISNNRLGTLFYYKNIKIELPLVGNHQIINCLLAIETSKIILGKLDRIKTNNAIKKTIWPGRIENIMNSGVYYDVSHNYESIVAMINNIKKLYPKKSLAGLFCLKNIEDIDSICKIIAGSFKKIILCQDQKLYLLDIEAISNIMGKFNNDYLVAKSVKDGIKKLKSFNNKNFVKIIFGSHYIAEEVYSEF